MLEQSDETTHGSRVNGGDDLLDAEEEATKFLKAILSIMSSCVIWSSLARHGLTVVVVVFTLC